jgi:hypothetical protein
MRMTTHHYHHHYQALTQSDVLHCDIRSRWEDKYHLLTKIFFLLWRTDCFSLLNCYVFFTHYFYEKKNWLKYVRLSVYRIHWWWLSPSFNSNICVLLLKYHYILKLECWEEKTIKYNIWKKKQEVNSYVFCCYHEVPTLHLSIKKNVFC